MFFVGRRKWEGISYAAPKRTRRAARRSAEVERYIDLVGRELFSCVQLFDRVVNTRR